MRSHACEHSQTVSVSCVQTVIHSRLHSIRPDKRVQSGAGDKQNINEEQTYAHPLHFGNFVNDLFLPIM